MKNFILIIFVTLLCLQTNPMDKLFLKNDSEDNNGKIQGQ